MSYNNGIVETEYLDPVSFTNSRCAFEINPNRLGILPNMRLLNVGADNSRADTTQYARGTGAAGVIKNIRLMDARTELSSLRNVAPYLQFKNTGRTNAPNKSLDSFLKRNELGFEVDGSNNKLQHLYLSGFSSTPATNTTDAAYINLQMLLPVLERLIVLPTSTFKNLRLEIEFHTSAAAQLFNNDTAIPTTLRPILAYDYVSDPRVLAPMVEQMNKGIVWNEVEWDNFVIPAVTLGTDITQVQTTNNNSLGFIGKKVGRLLIVNTLQDPSLEVDSNVIQGFGGPQSSQAVLNQTTNIRLNGKNVFPGANGVTGSNEMLGVLADAYGDRQCYPGSNLYQWSRVPGLLDTPSLSGQSSYACCEIGARVADLQVSLQRTNNQDTSVKSATNDGLQINLYAEISKVITFQDGRYSVVYE
tara:strand:+ start:3713 stop:4960 length:1248 start_codon:yes stop_codon:yes gene_type:complete